MFKVKSSKKRITTAHNAKEAATLDARHQQILQDMQEKQGKLDDLVEEQAQLRLDLDAWNVQIAQMKESDMLDTPPYDAAWSSNIHISQQLRAIEHEIARIQSREDEINYFERTASILFEYYDLIESQADIATTPRLVEPPRAPKGRKKAAPVVATRSILEAFKIVEPVAPPAAVVPSTSTSVSATTSASAATAAAATAVKPVLDKSALVDDFMAATDASYVRPCTAVADTGLCEECQTPLLCMQQEGIMICSKCGYQELLLVEQNRPILRIPSAKEASHFSYKRINHFKEWCAQIQGKESTDIPEEVFERILAEIKKEKIRDPKTITYAKMREILKRLRINKYYEHIAYIIQRIAGTEAPHFSPELEEKLCSMFKEIQGPFLKHCPSSRKNFMSYSYVLRKLFEQLGLEHYMNLFPLLRSREKLYAQDQIYSKICKDLGWPFKPSL